MADILTTSQTEAAVLEALRSPEVSDHIAALIDRSARRVVAELGLSDEEVWGRIRASFMAERGAA